MFILHKGSDSSGVDSGIAACERDPEKIFQAMGSEVTVVAEHNQGHSIDGVSDAIALAERSQHRVVRRGSLASRRVDGQHAWATDAGFCEVRGDLQIGRQFGRQLAFFRADRRDHELGALVQGAAAVIQRIHRRTGMKVKVASPVDSPQPLGQEACDVIDP